MKPGQASSPKVTGIFKGNVKSLQGFSPKMLESLPTIGKRDAANSPQKKFSFTSAIKSLVESLKNQDEVEELYRKQILLEKKATSNGLTMPSTMTAFSPQKANSDKEPLEGIQIRNETHKPFVLKEIRTVDNLESRSLERPSKLDEIHHAKKFRVRVNNSMDQKEAERSPQNNNDNLTFSDRLSFVSFISLIYTC